MHSFILFFLSDCSTTHTRCKVFHRVMQGVPKHQPRTDDRLLGSSNYTTSTIFMDLAHVIAAITSHGKLRFLGSWSTGTCPLRMMVGVLSIFGARVAQLIVVVGWSVLLSRYLVIAMSDKPFGQVNVLGAPRARHDYRTYHTIPARP